MKKPTIIAGLVMPVLLGMAPTATAQPQDSTAHIHDHLNLNEVVVTGLTGTTKAKYAPQPVSLVTRSALLSQPATNLVAALAHQPGLSQVTTGNGISKPVIRGLGYNRVLVMDDGVRQEGQQWGDEHGLEVDAQTVQSVEILKGPASLMYGSDAMAGVLILHDAPTLPQGETRAELTAEHHANSGLWAYSAWAGGHERSLVWNARWSQRLAHEYKTPVDGYVAGSQLREQAAKGMVGLQGAWGHSLLRLSHYHQTPGIVEGEDEEKRTEWSYGRTLPFQQIRHTKAVSDNMVRLGDGTLTLLVALQQNRRQEYEDEADEAELDFRLRTATYDLRYLTAELEGWRMAAGLAGMHQHSENMADEVLIPAYRLNDVGLYATATHTIRERVTLSGGLRWDHRHLKSYALEERFAPFTRGFDGTSASLGAIWNACRHINVKLNVARGFRAPNASELGSNGEHEGTFRYELGNRTLKPEHSWQADLGLDASGQVASAQVALFANHIDNYIFLERLPATTPLASVVPEGCVVDADGTALYQYTAGTARIWGAEASLDLHLLEPLHFQNTFSYVEARQLHQPAASKYLPMTPAPRWTMDLHYDLLPHSHTLCNAYAALGLECCLRQNHVRSANDTETPTPSYTLLSASAGTDVYHKGRRRLSLYLMADNLTNRAYQSHLSRLKYGPVHETTGRRGVMNPGRNIVVKAVVPILL